MRIAQFIILTAFGITIYLGSIQYTKKYVIYDEDNTEEKCNSSSLNDKREEGTKCHVWDGHQCRIGKVNASNGMCVSEGNYIPIILVGLSFSFIISGIVSLFT